MGTQPRSLVYHPPWLLLLQEQSRIVVTENAWSRKPKIFIIWPFLEKVC